MDPAQVDDYFASAMVDVAYVVSTGPDSADIVADCSDHLRNPEGREWLRGILQSALADCGEIHAAISFL
ncbi:hypothetical protein [Luteolibacter sp. Populi]|uniref:hypothetical protein n=1 Tax=Luteolibacter sp. Populi TaxID=3230487 RepID=UPI003465D774